MKLEHAVKEILIDELDGMNEDEARYYFANPEQYSCVNGCVSALIYYKDTEGFAKEYHDEIVALMSDYGMDKCLPLNDMAWFAYEAIVPTLEDEIMSELYEDEDEDEGSII